MPPFRLRRQAAALGHPMALLAALLLGNAPSPAWTQISDGRSPLAVYALVTPRDQAPSGLIARVVLPAGVGCPALETQQGGPGLQPWRPLPMVERRAAASTQRAFDSLLVCEAPIPEGAHAARIAGRRLPASLPARVEKLAVLGDTGCRLAAGAGGALPGARAGGCGDLSG